jgi:hypothetical protein
MSVHYTETQYYKNVRGMRTAGWNPVVSSLRPTARYELHAQPPAAPFSLLRHQLPRHMICRTVTFYMALLVGLTAEAV